MDVEEDYAIECEKRMKAPLEWESLAKCKIVDLTEPLYDDALHLIKRHFFNDDPMCKASAFSEDKLSVMEYLSHIRTWIMDTTSLIATSLASGRVIGVAVMRIDNNEEKTHTYSRVLDLEGSALKKIMHLKHTLIKETKAHEKFGHNEYITIYILYVHPSYQQKGVEDALLNSCIQVAITMKMPAIGGIFTSGNSQSKAENMGFHILSEIRYSQWVIDDEVVFDDPGKGNYTIAFMGKIISLDDESPMTDQISLVDDTSLTTTKSRANASDETVVVK